ncbi:FMN-binding protein [Sulfuriferula sp. AH1]|uniref:FMN-binding protein n=1 Tax=Sulfuriferula sp. AH1 TaxID=1985873 RepID=UPI000B3B42CF|nr:FMN-binding protein [Sulfuriferula sp. AH1]ARU32942.1 FMN-binding protein [Sulfuriferula sp. AH1]
MSNFDRWLMVPALIIPAAASAPAFAVQYMNVEQAQKVLFPAADGFEAKTVVLSAEQKRAIEASSGVRVRVNEVKAWHATQGGKALGWFLLDEVYGKHEFITYAVGIGADGAVKGVEILDYRETHGSEVNNAKWRAQFTGKKAGDTLQLDEDIKNISGATLSCKHITDGVKRLLATCATVLK